MDASEPTPEFLAACLALLALRASIGESTALDRVLLVPSGSPMSTDAAAQMLAAKPKPLFCDAEAREGTLVVHCRTEAEADALERQLHATPRHPAEWRGFMGYLEQSYGPGDHLVAAFGRDESLITPHSVVDRWSREYEIVGIGYAGDEVDNPLAQTRDEYIEARSRGAKGVLLFSSSADSKVYSATIALQGNKGELSDEAEQQLVEIARMSRLVLQSITDDDPEANLIPFSGWDTWLRQRLKAEKDSLVSTAALLRQAFTGRAMPPDVAAFIEDCDKHLGEL